MRRDPCAAIWSVAAPLPVPAKPWTSAAAAAAARMAPAASLPCSPPAEAADSAAAAPAPHAFAGGGIVARHPSAVGLGESLLLAPGKEPRLLDPLLPLDPAAEAQVLVDPVDLHRVPAGDLVIVEETEILQGLLELGTDAADPLEIVRPVVARRGQALRPLRPTTGRRRLGARGGCSRRHLRQIDRRCRLEGLSQLIEGGKLACFLDHHHRRLRHGRDLGQRRLVGGCRWCGSAARIVTARHLTTHQQCPQQASDDAADEECEQRPQNQLDGQVLHLPLLALRRRFVRSPDRGAREPPYDHPQPEGQREPQPVVGGHDRHVLEIPEIAHQRSPWGSTTHSMRRLRALPSAVRLLATGSLSPWPTADRRSTAIPCCTSASTITAARRSLKARLKVGEPIESL